jgi:hypothetical protein
VKRLSAVITTKGFARVLGFLLLSICFYFVVAFVLSSVPVNADFKECEKEAVEIHILTNGVHTDLVLPYRNQYMDWSKWVNPSQTKSGDSSAVNVAFGWGDKGFYLETKTWDEFGIIGQIDPFPSASN